jgi:uracil-DNA glycosylase family 4
LPSGCVILPVQALGSTFSEVMVVGLKPGPAEEPYAGNAGRLVRLIAGSMLSRCYLTNAIKRNVSGNDLPTLLSTGSLTVDVDRVRPKVMVTLGSIVTSYVIGQKVSISTVHGLLIPVQRFGREFTVLPVWDPGYVLRKGGLMSEVGSNWVTDWLELYNVEDLNDLKAYAEVNG